MVEHRLAPGTFAVFAGDALRLGSCADPTSVYEIQPDVLAVLSRFVGWAGADDVLDEIGVDEHVRAALAGFLQKLERDGLLVRDDAVVPALVHPSALKDAEVELARVLDLASDIRAVDPGFLAIEAACRPFTLTSLPLMYALFQATRHVVTTGIPGDIVECGVWRGGSAMVCARTLLAHGSTDRKLFLYDTFDWTFEAPCAHDGFLHVDGDRPLPAHTDVTSVADGLRAGVSVGDVRRNLASTGYPDARVITIPGFVQHTIPARAPERIAILRLDTDLYDSTYHELAHLFPRLQPGGVLVVDDYGKLSGATRAVDDYFAEHRIHMLLQRVDIQGRVGIKG